MMIVHHALDVQVLNANQGEPPRQIRGQLVKRVCTNVSNPSMQPGQLPPGLLAIAGFQLLPA